MKTFEKYLREQTGLNFDDCRNLNVESEILRNLFADWIKADKPCTTMIFNALDVMSRANIDF